jgi:hypothetical protein
MQLLPLLFSKTIRLTDRACLLGLRLCLYLDRMATSKLHVDPAHIARAADDDFAKYVDRRPSFVISSC